MLQLIHQKDSPVAITFLPWQNPAGQKKTLCIAKQAYAYDSQQQAWVPCLEPPEFIWTDDWTDDCNRQRSDIQGIKSQCEILLQGPVQSGACLSYQQADEVRVLIRVGKLAPFPVLYWQSDWKCPVTSKASSLPSVVVPPYAQLDVNLEEGSLLFERLFLEASLPVKTRFDLKQSWPALHVVLPGFTQAYAWIQDTIQIDTEKTVVSCLAKAYLHWDCLSDKQASVVIRSR